jgi:hypothetical protein
MWLDQLFVYLSHVRTEVNTLSDFDHERNSGEALMVELLSREESRQRCECWIRRMTGYE